MNKLFLIGIVALFLAAGTAHATEPDISPRAEGCLVEGQGRGPCPPPRYLKEAKLLYELNAICRLEAPTAEAETPEMACAARDKLIKKFADRGYCFYGHGVLGVYSKDKRHCYERKSLWPKD
jgi:hypothetical protein